MRGLAAWLLLIGLLGVAFVALGGLRNPVMVTIMVVFALTGAVAVTFLLRRGPR